jgi:uncharacterized damage-inducible protein DinB
MQKEIIIKQIERIFHGPAWHGPSVMEVLSAIKEENKNAAHKNSHSIVELVGHITAWRKFVIEQLKGNNNYRVSEEMNFPTPTNLSETLDELKSTQAELVKCISNFPEERFTEKVLGKPFSYQTMLHGILHHDLYHIGQISLLNR